jgi:malate dehydrogenase (oxaloacetate-decarboxylating)(NADP+)
MNPDIKQAALDYHRFPVPGKISVETTKSMLSQHDLSLAYTPGVVAARIVERFGMQPRVALLAPPDSGSRSDADSKRARKTVKILQKRAPGLEVAGQMSVELALTARTNPETAPVSGLSASANLLVMPNLDAASIALGIMKGVANAVDVGPILIGSRYPVHILSNTVSVRGIVNMTAMAAAEA